MAGRHNTPPDIGIIVLAAGASSRMGDQDKLLKTIDGTALLRRVALRCTQSKATEIAAVLRPQDTTRRDVLCDLPLALTTNIDWEKGMATTIRRGLSILPLSRLDGVIVMLADMPDIATTDIDRLIDAFNRDRPETICRATTAEGRPGNPVLFGRQHFEALSLLTGDRGGKSILTDSAAFIVDVPLIGTRALTDLDRPQDWTRYFSQNKHPT